MGNSRGISNIITDVRAGISVRQGNCSSLNIGKKIFFPEAL